MSDSDSNSNPAAPENEAIENESIENEAPESEAPDKARKGPKVEKVTCVDCAKKWHPIDEANRFYRTPEGVHCAVKAPCRARQLGDEFERRKLNKWGRRTQEQLLAIMDCPPKDWDRKKPWKSVTEDTAERVAAAIEFYSLCYPVCLTYAVQTDLNGEPIWEQYLGAWRAQTSRSLAEVLAVHQTTVSRAILDLKARHRIEEYEGRFYPVLDPKSLNPGEREACTRAISDSGTSFSALLPKARAALYEALSTYPPEACTQLRRIAVEACIVQNRAISAARTQASRTVIEACSADLSLLSRVLEGQSDPPSTSSSTSESGTMPANFPGNTDDDEKQERNEALYAAGAGQGALAKLPSPRNFPGGNGAPAADVTKPPEARPPVDIPLVSQPRSSKLPRAAEPPPPPLLELPTTNVIADAAACYSRPDEKGIIQILTDSRRHVPDLTEEEVAAMVHSKGPLARHKPNPFGFLITAVPTAFEGETYRRRRVREQEVATAEASRRAEEEERQKCRAIDNARELVAHPDDYPPDMVEWAQETLEEYKVPEVAPPDDQKPS